MAHGLTICRPYTREEDKAIFKYILDNNAYRRVKSIVFWRELEENNVVPNRTAVGLMGHFRVSLSKQLHNPIFGLDEAMKDKFRNAIYSYARSGPVRRPRGGVNFLEDTNSSVESQEVGVGNFTDDYVEDVNVTEPSQVRIKTERLSSPISRRRSETPELRLGGDVNLFQDSSSGHSSDETTVARRVAVARGPVGPRRRDRVDFLADSSSSDESEGFM